MDCSRRQNEYVPYIPCRISVIALWQLEQLVNSLLTLAVASLKFCTLHYDRAGARCAVHFRVISPPLLYTLVNASLPNIDQRIYSDHAFLAPPYYHSSLILLLSNP